MSESALLNLDISESSIQAFDEVEVSNRSRYSSCSCINPPCPIATMD
ncbi:hypothetical protein [Lactobacillus crispatus]|uniref:Uncharacterized protein n=1 Tax=Lactobacillus crispatus TaxID=47770 RepID=A0ABV2BD44_9LACO|nr:hypothetical protein [Lactobacillus crispatus]MBG0731537.1 hypothetical protein [Lactobacillus crispatus]MCZ4049841.1 hypothetical protein [Lactobacillus crispatus]